MVFAYVHIEVFVSECCSEFFVGGRRSNDSTPALLISEEVGKPLFSVLEVTVWIQDVVGRVRIERRNSTSLTA